MKSGWVEKRLDECCEVMLGQSPPGDTYNDQGMGLPFFQGKTEFGAMHPNVAKWCSAPKKIAEAGDILISVRAPVGPTNVADQRCCIGRGLAAIRPRDGITARWVLYGLRASESIIAAKATGTTFSAISGRGMIVHNGSPQIVQKLWNYCNILRDDGLSYGDYVEQLTFLLFLKMAHEQTLRPWKKPSIIPKGFDWPSLDSRDGDDLETHYRHTLETLGKQDGMLGLIFRKAQNKIQDPAKLKRLISDLIDAEQWVSLDADVKGDAYEGLLEKNAQDVKGGAGQYFTPRALIQAMVEVMRPMPGESICDPACGTGGFLLAAHDFIVRTHPTLDKDEKKHLKLKALKGVELVTSVARLCAMNLLLHGVGPSGNEAKPPIEGGKDSLLADPGDRFDVVLTNPPFGKKSSVLVINEEGDQEREALTVVRDDFWASTSNKQLNFVQHVKTLVKINGRAAVVVPDNVLFEGGAGETVRRKLLHECDVHTLLRLPTGIFYAQGVKANVLFFDRKPASEKPWTKKLWIYDLRTNKHFTLKTSSLQRTDLDEFVACYRAKNRHTRKPTWSDSTSDGRWLAYEYDEIVKRDKCSLDIFWLRDESLENSDNLPPPEVIAAEIVEDLKAALEQFAEIQADLTRRS